MCDIPADISGEELTRRMAAFYDDFRGMWPTLTLHGVQFRAVPTPAASKNPTSSPAPAEAPRQSHAHHDASLHGGEIGDRDDNKFSRDRKGRAAG